MQVGRPPPGEELNTGDVSEPREAASVIVLRDSPDGQEVLLVQRNPEQRFMGGAWVFPGGARHGDDRRHEDTAVRELAEEAAVRLPADAELVPFARWITPAAVKVRFDTWFFAVRAPDGVDVRTDGRECVDWRWSRPDEALAAYAREELVLVFPTIKLLERIARTASVDETLAAARGREVDPIEPRVVVRDGTAEVLIPGDPGYDEG